MKSILYVGATLMIGASIYGFVDYNKTRTKKEFKEMYVEKPAMDREVGEAVPVIPVNKTEALDNDKTTTISEATVSQTTAVRKTIKKDKKVNKRKFKPELFSRAALEEKFIDEETQKPIDPKINKEPAKVVEKKSVGDN